MAINLAALKEMLQPGLMEVQGKYKDVDPEWKDIFVTKKSRMQIERVLHTRMVGMAQIKKEGNAPAVDNQAGARWTVNMETVEAGIMYTMTRKAIADGLYESEFTPANLNLNAGMRAFWNMYAANIFNNASTYDTATGGDGKALLATDHPLDMGTYANTSATPLALNETSLLGSYENIYTGFYDEAGIRMDANAECLVVPAHLEAVGRRLQGAVLRPDSANNDPNVINKVHAAADRLKVMRYLTSKYAWFLTTNIKGLVHLQREAYETHMWHDDATHNLNVSNYERAGFFCTNPRAVYGELATA